MRKVMYFMGICLLSASFIGCSKGDNKGNKIKNIKLNSIVEVKENCDNDLENAKNGKYKNLKFDDISIYKEFPNEIYSLTGEISCVTDITDIKVGVDRISKEFFNVFGEDVNKNGLYVNLSSVDDEERIDTPYEELLMQLDNGNYDNGEVEFGAVYYDEETLEGVEKDDGFIYFQSNFENSPMFIKKQLYADKGFADDYDVLDSEKVYYKYMKNQEALNDRYKLLSGEEWTIKEAIDYVEDMVNDEKNGLSIVSKLVVENVYVCKRGDDAYQFDCVLRREEDGMLFNSGPSIITYEEGSFLEKYVVDAIKISVTGINEWSCLLNWCDAAKLEKVGEKITDIISLDKALQIISEGVGLNSTYIINSVEMSYLELIDDSNEGVTIYNFEPKWKIDAINENDNKNTKFFVDIQTGEVIEIQL